MSDFNASKGSCRALGSETGNRKTNACKEYFVKLLNGGTSITRKELQNLMYWSGGNLPELEERGHTTLFEHLGKKDALEFITAFSEKKGLKIQVQAVLKKLISDLEFIKVWNQFEGSTELTPLGKPAANFILISETTTGQTQVSWKDASFSSNLDVFKAYFDDKFESGKTYDLDKLSDGNTNRDHFVKSIENARSIIDQKIIDMADASGLPMDEDADPVEVLNQMDEEDFDSIAVPLLAGKDPDEIKISGDTLRNFLQCYLINEFLNDERFRKTMISDFSQPIPEKTGTDYYSGRIIPIKMKEPKKFLNYALFEPDHKNFFSDRKSQKFNTSMTYDLCCVKKMSDGSTAEAKINLGKVQEDAKSGRPIHWTDDDEQALKALKTNKRKNPTSFSDANAAALSKLEEKKQQALNGVKKVKTTINKRMNLEVVFDGTNPSTARKDVKASLTVQLTSFSNLTSKIADINGEAVKLYELITVPYGIAPAGASLPGSSIRNQYSPDYNRLRLKIKNKAEGSVNSDLIIDLAVIDHSIGRNETGIVELKINYRGYFETLLSLPFMDALATNSIVKNRLDRDAQLKEAVSKKCSEQTLREIIRLNRGQDSYEAKTSAYSSLVNRLYQKRRVVPYEIAQRKIRLFVTAGLISTNATSNTSEGRTFSADLRSNWNKFYSGGSKKDQFTSDITSLEDLDEEIKGKSLGDADGELDFGSYFKSYFFPLGDLLEVGLDCIYEDKTYILRNHMKESRLRFLAAPVEVKDPKNPKNPIKFNPLAMPVDLYYFKNWLRDNVIDKGVTYMSALMMIRSLIERMVNNLMYEACFSDFLADERPPMLRTTFISDTSTNLLRYWYHNNHQKEDESKSPILDLDAYMKSNPGKLFEQNSDKPIRVNWCVIYMQSFNDVLPYNEKTYKKSEFVPTLEFGVNTNDSFVNKVDFSKSNSPGLKEARYFNERGTLSILSNVYDLKITLMAAGGTTSIYPGHVINVVLTDFAVGERDPHQTNTLANNLGFGGYYIVKKVTYSLPTQSSKYTITYDTKWIGSDASIQFRKARSTTELIDTEACVNIYNEVAERVRSNIKDEEELERLNLLEARTEEDLEAEATEGGERVTSDSGLSDQEILLEEMAFEMLANNLQSYIVSDPPDKFFIKEIKIETDVKSKDFLFMVEWEPLSTNSERVKITRVTIGGQNFDLKGRNHFHVTEAKFYGEE